MYFFHIRKRLRLLLNTKKGRRAYYKQLPVEDRVLVTAHIFIYSWKFPTCWHKNIKQFYSYLLQCVFENKRIHTDWWEIESSLSHWILPRLRYLRDHCTGYPTALREFNKNKRDDGFNSWKFILGEMIFAFEFEFRISKWFMGMPPPVNSAAYDWYIEMEKRKNKGIEYFVMYKSNLWD